MRTDNHYNKVIDLLTPVKEDQPSDTDKSLSPAQEKRPLLNDIFGRIKLGVNQLEEILFMADEGSLTDCEIDAECLLLALYEQKADGYYLSKDVIRAMSTLQQSLDKIKSSTTKKMDSKSPTVNLEGVFPSTAGKEKANNVPDDTVVETANGSAGHNVDDSDTDSGNSKNGSVVYDDDLKDDFVETQDWGF